MINVWATASTFVHLPMMILSSDFLFERANIFCLVHTLLSCWTSSSWFETPWYSSDSTVMFWAEMISLWTYDFAIHVKKQSISMMRLSNGNIFSVTDLLGSTSPVTGGFPHKDQWHRALVFPLICAWTNGWANNRDADDLRRHRAHYDAIVMSIFSADVAFG